MFSSLVRLAEAIVLAALLFCSGCGAVYQMIVAVKTNRASALLGAVGLAVPVLC